MKTVEPNKEYSLNELSRIKGAFDAGNKYTYVSDSGCVYTQGQVYACSGSGIYDNLKTDENKSQCSIGDRDCLFVKVSDTKLYWDGESKLEAGMWVQTSTGVYEVILPADEESMVLVKDKGTYILQDFSGCKPIVPRTDAEQVCIDIYNDYVRHEVVCMSSSLRNAWEIGEGLVSE